MGYSVRKFALSQARMYAGTQRDEDGHRGMHRRIAREIADAVPHIVVQFSMYLLPIFL